MKKIILFSSMFLIAAFANAQDSKNTTDPKTGEMLTPAGTPVGAPAAAPAPVKENPNAADFKFDVEEYNFGTIKQGDKVTYDFNFANIGKEPLVITEAHGSCGCTVPSWPKEPVAKGAKAQIHVEFNSAGKQGMQDKTVTINSNAKQNPMVLHVKGNVEKPIEQPAVEDKK